MVSKIGFFVSGAINSLYIPEFIVSHSTFQVWLQSWWYQNSSSNEQLKHIQSWSRLYSSLLIWKSTTLSSHKTLKSVFNHNTYIYKSRARMLLLSDHFLIGLSFIFLFWCIPVLFFVFYSNSKFLVCGTSLPRNTIPCVPTPWTELQALHLCRL